MAIGALTELENERVDAMAAGDEPCPFCDEVENIVVIRREYSGAVLRWQVVCQDCGSRGPETKSNQGAVDGWEGEGPI